MKLREGIVCEWEHANNNNKQPDDDEKSGGVELHSSCMSM